jgi:hypothetical protein
MVGYGYVGQCWPLEADVRSIDCRNSRNCLRKFFLFLHRSHIFLTSDLAAKKEDLDLCTFAFRWFLCLVFYNSSVW